MLHRNPYLKILTIVLLFSAIDTNAQLNPSKSTDSINVENGRRGVDTTHNPSQQLFKSYLKLSDSSLLKYNAGFNHYFITDKLNAQQAVGYMQKGYKIPDIKKIAAELDALEKQLTGSPIRIKDAEVTYNGQVNTMLLDSGRSFMYNQVIASQALNIYQLPVNISYRFQDYSTPLYPAMNTFSSDFNKDEFLAGMKKKLAGKFNPEDLAKKLPNVAEELKNTAARDLSKQINGLEGKYGSLVEKYKNQLGDLPALVSKDTKGLRQELMKNFSPADIEAKRNLYEQLQTRANNGEVVDKDLMSKLSNDMRELELINELVNTVDQQKKQWQADGLLNKIRENEQSRKVKVDELANDPSTIKKLAREKLNLSSLQKFFLNVNKLTLGQGVANQSGLSAQHYLLNGINTEFLNERNSYLGLMFGGHNDFSSLSDRMFSSFQNSASNLSSGIRLGKGDPGSAHSHLSFNLFKMGSSQNGFNTQTISPRTINVFGLDNSFNIGERGSINVEFSKSSAKYEMVQSPIDSFQQNKSVLNALYGGENFFQNLAVNIDYRNTYKSIDLDHSTYVRYVGTAYTNPGNYFLPSGGKETGTQLKKSFFKKRLQAGVRYNIREYKFSEQSDQRWINTMANMDLRWKMRRGEYIGIRYQPTKMNRVEAGNKSTINNTDRISTEVSLNKKLFHKPYRTYLSLALQNNDYTLADSGRIKSRGVLLNSFQSLQIKSYSLFFNLSYNLADNRSQYVYFNSSINSDAGISYQLLKSISASSSITYSQVKSWYEQAGIRQTFSGQIRDNISFNFYVDARMNIKEYQEFYQDLIRAEWGIRYHFKNASR